jgi:hypothetical protein
MSAKGLLTPFVLIAVSWKKPVSYTDTLSPSVPAMALPGSRADMVGAGFMIEKLMLFDVPPPGLGVVIVMGNAPPVPSISFGMSTRRLWLSSKVVDKV